DRGLGRACLVGRHPRPADGRLRKREQGLAWERPAAGCWLPAHRATQALLDLVTARARGRREQRRSKSTTDRLPPIASSALLVDLAAFLVLLAVLVEVRRLGAAHDRKVDRGLGAGLDADLGARRLG